ncbi:hypothetical protein IJD44_09640 [bacterium]|nr:hypothetical protein [bacterium]
MPNGISCLFFAGRNFIYGAKEENLFKSGVGVIQTVRSADFFANTNIPKTTACPNNAATSSVSGVRALATKKNPVLAVLGETAKKLKKVLYPLFIASGIYNTIKSDDKIKTGTSQASGIASMYAFEKGAEKILPIIEKSILSHPFVKRNKIAQGAVYVARGMTYAAISLAGYSTGSKIAEKGVDTIRLVKENRTEKKEIKKQINDIFESTIDSIGKAPTANVFEDIASGF